MILPLSSQRLRASSLHSESFSPQETPRGSSIRPRYLFDVTDQGELLQIFPEAQ
ncbi:hypothetical protein SH661x_000325 [Planctomicrobium sp. SH661]|uniref:hypothetical protein n=1 Tax=Planctomicrobium sp. SH661 TaxID=3448124 RepID=UPI003F5C6D5E